jgi:argininosuccinate lyase
MPQKRNPVALEHARALASKALGQAAAIPLVVHNTPFGDIVDTEDDLQPLVASMFKDAERAIALVAAAMRDAEFDVDRMRARAAEGWVTITELADTLAREHGVSFGTAHAIATRVVAAARDESDPRLSEHLAQAAQQLIGREIRLSPQTLARVLSPEHFVEVRRTPGGPAPELTGAAVDRSRLALTEDEADSARRRATLEAASHRLRQAVDAL